MPNFSLPGQVFLAAAQQYAQTLASVIMPVWQQEDIQGTAADIGRATWRSGV